MPDLGHVESRIRTIVDDAKNNYALAGICEGYDVLYELTPRRGG
jgi:hypothetical protein